MARYKQKWGVRTCSGGCKCEAGGWSRNVQLETGNKRKSRRIQVRWEEGNGTSQTKEKCA